MGSKQVAVLMVQLDLRLLHLAQFSCPAGGNGKGKGILPTISKESGG